MANIIKIDISESTWYAMPNVPIIRFNSDKKLGHVREWIVTNLENDVFISFYKIPEEFKQMLLLLATKEDYIAFKLMFPEYC